MQQKNGRHPIAQDIISDLNSARSSYMSHVQSRLEAAFKAAVSSRQSIYGAQAEKDQFANNLMIIAIIAGGIAFVPIGASGAAAGNWLARGWAGRVLTIGGGKASIKQLRALAQTRASKIVKLGFHGFSHDHSVFVGSFTRAGANITNALAGYGFIQFRKFAAEEFSFDNPKSKFANVTLDPAYYGSDLKIYIQDMFDAWIRFIKELDSDPNMPDDQWCDLHEAMKKAPVLKSPGTPDKELTQSKFELLFYLHDLLARSTHTTFIPTSRRGSRAGKTPRVVPVPSPSSEHFPFYKVEYFDPGTTVGKKINELYSFVYNKDHSFKTAIPYNGGKFFNNLPIWNDVDREVLKKAETCLEALILGTNPTEI